MLNFSIDIYSICLKKVNYKLTKKYALSPFYLYLHRYFFTIECTVGTIIFNVNLYITYFTWFFFSIFVYIGMVLNNISFDTIL